MFQQGKIINELERYSVANFSHLLFCTRKVTPLCTNGINYVFGISAEIRPGMD